MHALSIVFYGSSAEVLLSSLSLLSACDLAQARGEFALSAQTPLLYMMLICSVKLTFAFADGLPSFAAGLYIHEGMCLRAGRSGQGDPLFMNICRF